MEESSSLMANIWSSLMRRLLTLSVSRFVRYLLTSILWLHSTNLKWNSFQFLRNIEKCLSEPNYQRANTLLFHHVGILARLGPLPWISISIRSLERSRRSREWTKKNSVSLIIPHLLLFRRYYQGRRWCCCLSWLEDWTYSKENSLHDGWWGQSAESINPQ